MNNTIQILNAGDYSIFIGNIQENLSTWLSELNYSSVFILVDENTSRQCLPHILSVTAIADPIVIQISSGESFKTIDTAELIWKKLLEGKADKNSLLLNLGGGVITDIGGFAAALYKRGIDFVNIPTTLLGMVDAAIGGKTGVDFHHVKNAVGIIKNPAAVFVDPVFLKTLANDQLFSGMAEMLKHGLIAGGKVWEEILALNSKAENPSLNNIASSIEVKLSIVKQDPEEKNIRKQLNFGHTIGHALESWLLQKGQPTLHGFCIAAGMIAELHLSELALVLNKEEKESAINLIHKLFPPIFFQEKDIDDIIRFMEQDKKNADGKIGFVLMQQVGMMVIGQYPVVEQIQKSLLYYLKADRL